MKLHGIYPIVPTPFLDNGQVDYTSIERLIDFMAEKRVHGLAIMGALGEGPKLTGNERTQIIDLYRSRMPADMGLVVGVRAPATDPAMIMAQSAREQGLTVFSLALTIYRKTNHFSNITSWYPRRPASHASSMIIPRSQG